LHFRARAKCPAIWVIPSSRPSAVPAAINRAARSGDPAVVRDWTRFAIRLPGVDPRARLGRARHRLASPFGSSSRRQRPPIQVVTIEPPHRRRTARVAAQGARPTTSPTMLRSPSSEGWTTTFFNQETIFWFDASPYLPDECRVSPRRSGPPRHGCPRRSHRRSFRATADCSSAWRLAALDSAVLHDRDDSSSLIIGPVVVDSCSHRLVPCAGLKIRRVPSARCTALPSVARSGDSHSWLLGRDRPRPTGRKQRECPARPRSG
jgi:hypothetical protein